MERKGKGKGKGKEMERKGKGKGKEREGNRILPAPFNNYIQKTHKSGVHAAPSNCWLFWYLKFTSLLDKA